VFGNISTNQHFDNAARGAWIKAALGITAKQLRLYKTTIEALFLPDLPNRSGEWS
jgi:hypothetical protein